jgi:hypothetical protein
MPITTKIEKRHSYWYWTVVFSPDGTTKLTCEGARTTRKAARESAELAKAVMLEGIRKVPR